MVAVKKWGLAVRCLIRLTPGCGNVVNMLRHDYTVYDASRGQRPTGSTQKCSTRSPVEILWHRDRLEALTRTAETSSYLLIFSAPSRTRTDTGRILSPLPLPIGLWGPQVPCATERKGRVPGHTADAAELATPEGEPPDWVTG
jgi:hypothetical protein